MALTVGTRLGPYEVTAPLGEGGMGEVYRARDTKLGRDVALKILPELFVHDADRLARFKREAQVLASLNHPNIAAIHGIEDSGSVTALVLELVEGPTLADRIAGRTPEAESASSRPRDSNARPARGGGAPRGLEIDDALPIARQIVAALEEAHGRGIVHRDLKPANISVREDGTVKVLDFGLAKLAEPSGASSAPSNLANSPTVTSPAMTAMGMILGTAAYMSPEQARGRVVDKRADIWAFGCVLYEMVTGRRAFDGNSVSDTLADILRGEPDWTALPADAPAALRRLLRRCLTKDPAQRLPDIGVARLEIDEALASASDEAGLRPPVTIASSRRRWLTRAAFGILAIALIVVSTIHLRERPAALPTLRFTVAPAPGTAFPATTTGSAVNISPDGNLVVFRAIRQGGTAATLWVRDLATMEVRELPGTTGGSMPFWSPDGRAIGFFAQGLLKRIDAAGGPVQTLCDARLVGGGAWGPDGSIVFGGGAGLSRVAAAGGPVTEITTLSTARREVAHVMPAFLPDGRRFLFRSIPNGILIGSLDASEPTPLLESESQALYTTGYVLFVRLGRLMAQAFDASSVTLRGDPVPVADQVQSGGQAHSLFSVSRTGILAYQSGTTRAGGEPVWVDRKGRELGPVAAGLKNSQYPRLSPDGQRLAIVTDADLWVHDLRGRPPIKLTFDGHKNERFSPLWSPDGRHLIFESGGQNQVPLGLWSLPADGSNSTPLPISPQAHLHPHGWTAGGRELLAVQLPAGAGGDIVTFVPGEKAELRPVVQTPAGEGGSGVALSPDGRWLAYAANPTGSQEIWVRPYPGPGAAVRVSPGGGTDPVWARNGRELFYRQGARLLATSIGPGAELRFTTPVVLFEGDYARGSQPPGYDVAPDGRFLLLKSPAVPEFLSFTVVVNWIEELERRSRPE